ncbi:hypothetical protein ASG25_15500 [Rhizobium sp. Leaf384]|uniref:hypothetical protein n=1 Tax=unclassified Rhizobium TaxID=2613769 RepID=UPI0007156409|nr:MULTISPECIES: hypothetical protein [unclassified Rhizobium]KQS76825.1 hypothetical protein ASG25_15500 [Rhizobium sp. Leaf384]KQS78095.1 hypothetical protein ASG58_06715 [Rhizobium sp. Leaf383]
MSEQMDRAKAFIDALPDGDLVVVAATNDVARWLANGIRERRGLSAARRCEVIGIRNRSSAAKLIGRLGRVILHDSFVSHARPEVRAEVERLMHGINVMDGAGDAT